MNATARAHTDQIEGDEVEIEEDELEVEVEGDEELEVEVVDEVDPKDRPRRSEDAEADIPDDDDLENYSEGVQKRLKKLTFEAREAERQRQEAIRQREEAVKYAQTVQQDNARLQEVSSKGQEYAVVQAKARAEAQVTTAEGVYRQAYEAGDTDALMEAQKLLSRAQNDLYRIETWRPPARQQQQQQPQPQQQPAQQQPQQPQLNPKQAAWLAENDTWYGKNEEMTGAALGIHERLVKNGVDPNSNAYYTEIDSVMRRRFADEFSDEVETVTPRRKASTVVAPAARTTKSPRRVKLTASQAAIAKRLGLTPKQYAEQVMKDQANG
jgi:hypothetical protein